VIGDAQLELGRYRAASRTIQRMVDARPDLPSYARVSYARELVGDVRGALAAMRLALAAAGTAADAAWVHHQIGELWFGRGGVSEAAESYRRSLDLTPDFVPALAGLAKVAWARGDLELAVDRYREVVARYPAPEHVIALADLYRLSGRPRLAGRAEALAEAQERLLAVNGVRTDLELALFDADHGRPGRALAAARAEWARRRSVHVADALAWALARRGRYGAAADLIAYARSTGYRNALFLFHDAVIRKGLGDRDGARRLLRRALAWNPNFSILHRDRAVALLERLGGGA
jgi:tetratricopeptide (TPR) repeat protein